MKLNRGVLLCIALANGRENGAQVNEPSDPLFDNNLNREKTQERM